MTARIASRPEAADPFLRDVLLQFFGKRHSIAKLIKNSAQFSGIFNKHVRNIEECPVESTRIRNLRYAKQRYESCQRPRARAVLFIDAVLLTAFDIVVARPGKEEARQALAFLEWVDEEKLLCLAMAAEYGNITMQLIRFFDDPAFDLAAVPAELEAWRAQADYLFVEGHCLDTGLTHYMLARLMRVQTFFLPSGPKSIGDPRGMADDTIRRCMQRMQCCVKLGLEVLHAELPAWDIMLAFEIFSLSDSQTSWRTVHAKHAGVIRHIKRLAQFFKLDEGKLTAEFQRVAPIATQIKHDNPGFTALDAWSATLQKLEKHKRGTFKCSLRALRPVLERFAAWNGCTTSCVEQAFSRDRGQSGTSRVARSTSLQNDELTLVVGSHDVGSLLRRAQRHWLARYGVLREAVAARLDKGKPRKQAIRGDKRGYN
jgi:hypothetical protein